MADVVYLSQKNYKLVADKEGTPYIKPKKNSQMKSKGRLPWKNMISLFNRFYSLHQRVEAGWCSLKSIIGDAVRSRIDQTVETEIWPKIIRYNLIRTIRGSYEFCAKPFP